jgi:hypothetical protein
MVGYEHRVRWVPLSILCFIKCFHICGKTLTLGTPLSITSEVLCEPPLFLLSIQINKLITMPVMVFSCLNSPEVKIYLGSQQGARKKI